MIVSIAVEFVYAKELQTRSFRGTGYLHDKATTAAAATSRVFTW